MCDFPGSPNTWEEIWHGVKVLVNLKQGVVKVSKVFPQCIEIFGWDFGPQMQQMTTGTRTKGFGVYQGFANDAELLEYFIKLFHEEEGYRVLKESEVKRGGRGDRFYLISLASGGQKRFISSLIGPVLPPTIQSEQETKKMLPKTRPNPVQGHKTRINFYGEEEDCSISGLSRVPGFIPNPILTPEQQMIQMKWRIEQSQAQKKGQGQTRVNPTLASKLGGGGGHGQVNSSASAFQSAFPTLNEALVEPGKGDGGGKKMGQKQNPPRPQGPKTWNKLF